MNKIPSSTSGGLGGSLVVVWRWWLRRNLFGCCHLCHGHTMEGHEGLVTQSAGYRFLVGTKMSKVYQSAEKWEHLTPKLLLLWYSLPSKRLVFRIFLGIRNCSKKDWFWREEGLKHRSDGKTHGGLVHDSWRIDMNLCFYVWICFVSRVSYVSCDILMMFSPFWLGFALRRHLD